MSSAKTYICLDIGGTYIKHGLLTETGEILIKGKIPTRAKEGGQAVFEQAVGVGGRVSGEKEDFCYKRKGNRLFESRQRRTLSCQP